MCPGCVAHPLEQIHRGRAGGAGRERQEQQGRVSDPVEKQGPAVHQQTIARRGNALDAILHK